MRLTRSPHSRLGSPQASYPIHVSKPNNALMSQRGGKHPQKSLRFVRIFGLAFLASSVALACSAVVAEVTEGSTVVAPVVWTGAL